MTAALTDDTGHLLLGSCLFLQGQAALMPPLQNSVSRTSHVWQSPSMLLSSPGQSSLGQCPRAFLYHLLSSLHFLCERIERKRRHDNLSTAEFKTSRILRNSREPISSEGVFSLLHCQRLRAAAATLLKISVISQAHLFGREERSESKHLPAGRELLHGPHPASSTRRDEGSVSMAQLSLESQVAGGRHSTWLGPLMPGVRGQDHYCSAP